MTDVTALPDPCGFCYVLAAMLVDVVIPALNEEGAIGKVLEGLTDPRLRRIVVADNGSSDQTAAVAARRGAIVLFEPRRGYGQACLAALDRVAEDPPDVVAFIDADFSDDPADVSAVLDRLDAGADLVIGSRTRGRAEKGALLPQARFGNWLATALVARLYGVAFTDLGPLRAVRYEALRRLRMCDTNFGWTVEMQVKAAKAGLRCAEVSVAYRPRIGTSKVTGTVWGSVRAGHKILWTIARERFTA